MSWGLLACGSRSCCFLCIVLVGVQGRADLVSIRVRSVSWYDLVSTIKKCAVLVKFHIKEYVLVAAHKTWVPTIFGACLFSFRRKFRLTAL